jgi:hypothetical protein
MALRLRRGTDAERLTITPVEGELIYTTDLQELWIGNGVTAGGNKVTGVIPQNLSDLNDVDTVSPQIGQVLKWNGERWEPSDDEDSGVVEDASYKINILGPVENTIVNSDTATFTGNFVGDGSGLTNLPIATDGSGVVEGSNYRINIISDDSTVIVNTANSTFTGNFVGDGSGLTNLPGVTSLSIFDLNDVFSIAPPDAGDTIIFDGANFVSQKIRQIEGADSTIIVDSNTNTFTGNFVGDGSGLTNLPSAPSQSIFDLNDVFSIAPPDAGDTIIFDGSNFVAQKIRQIEGADSTIIVDSNTNTFTGNFVGDGSGLTNLPSAPSQSIFDLNDVFSIAPPDAGDTIIFDGSNFVAQKIRQIQGTDDTIIVDSNTNTFTGNFVGDGSGLTNLPIVTQSIFDLNDVFRFENQTPDAGDVIIFDGANFVSQKIRQIEGADSTIIVNTDTNTFTGNFIGELTGSVFNTAQELIINADTNTFTGNFIGELTGSVFNTAQELIINADTNTFIGTFIGDGSGLTNLPNNTIQSIFDLDDVFRFENQTPDAGDVIIFDGANFVSQKIRQIEGADSTIIVNTDTNTFTGNFIGELTGSVFNTAQELIINADTNTFIGTFIGDGSGLTNLPESNGIVEGSSYRINIIGDDSTLLIDSRQNIISNGQLTFNGNLLTTNVNDPLLLAPAIVIGDIANTEVNTCVILNAPAGDPSLQIRGVYSDISESSKITFTAYGQSLDNPSLITEPGDVIGVFSFDVFEPLTSSRLPTALILAKTDPNAIVNSLESNGKIEFMTSGGLDIVNFLTFDSKGQLAVNQSTAQATLDINGFAKLAVLSEEPENPNNGMIAIADGDSISGWNPLGLSEPAKQQMVVRLGGAWIEIASAT